MNFVSVVILVVIAAVFVAVCIRLFTRRKSSCDRTGACEDCPLGQDCRDRRK